MRKLVRYAFLMGLAVASGNSAEAVITQLPSPAGLTLINDFETAINNSHVAFGTTAFLGIATDWAGWYDSPGWFTPSPWRGLVESGEPLSGVLASPATAVGMWFGNDDFDLVFDVLLEVFSGASSLGSVTVTSNGNDFADQFIGLSSDKSFDRFEVSYQRPAAQSLYIYVDDLYVGRTSVPEPATLVLLGIGISGIAYGQRYRLVATVSCRRRCRAPSSCRRP